MGSHDQPSLSCSLPPWEEWDAKGGEAASSGAVHHGSQHTGLRWEVTWWHQLWDRMGKPACALEGSREPPPAPIVWELKQEEPLPKEPGAWQVWPAAQLCGLQAFPGGPYRSRAGCC